MMKMTNMYRRVVSKPACIYAKKYTKYALADKVPFEEIIDKLLNLNLRTKVSSSWILYNSHVINYYGEMLFSNLCFRDIINESAECVWGYNDHHHTNPVAFDDLKMKTDDKLGSYFVKHWSDSSFVHFDYNVSYKHPLGTFRFLNKQDVYTVLANTIKWLRKPMRDCTTQITYQVTPNMIYGSKAYPREVII